MAKTLTVEFEFEIGDLVCFKHAPISAQEIPTRFLVVERQASECHGGVQRFYALRFGMDLKYVVAIELMPYPDEEVFAKMEAERLARREAYRQAAKERAEAEKAAGA